MYKVYCQWLSERLVTVPKTTRPATGTPGSLDRLEKTLKITILMQLNLCTRCTQVHNTSYIMYMLQFTFVIKTKNNRSHHILLTECRPLYYFTWSSIKLSKKGVLIRHFNVQPTKKHTVNVKTPIYSRGLSLMLTVTYLSCAGFIGSEKLFHLAFPRIPGQAFDKMWKLCCRDLLSVTRKGISEVGHWCWLIRPGPQSAFQFIPLGFRVRALCGPRRVLMDFLQTVGAEMKQFNPRDRDD